MASSLLLNPAFWYSVVKYGWPLFILIALGVSWQLGKKWPLEAIILEKRGNNLIKTNDRMCRKADQGFTHYRLMKSKDDIPIVNYDWVLLNVQKPTSIWEKIAQLIRGTQGTVFLFRYGSKQYKPIKITINGEVKEDLELVKDKNGNPVMINVYRPVDLRNIIGELNFEVVDWDNMNFIVQEWRIADERRKTAGDFWKSVLLPLGIILLCAIVCIFMIKFSYDYAINMGNKGSPTPQPTTQEQINSKNPVSAIIPAQ